MQDILRQRFALASQKQLDDYGVHIAGAALIVRNPGSVDAAVAVHESIDGTSYTPVVMYSPSGDADIARTIPAQASAVIAFASRSQYVRIVTSARLDEPLICDLIQLPPTANPPPSGY